MRDVPPKIRARRGASLAPRLAAVDDILLLGRVTGQMLEFRGAALGAQIKAHSALVTHAWHLLLSLFIGLFEAPIGTGIFPY